MKINKNMLGFSVIVTMLSLSGVLSLNQYLKERVSHDRIDIRSFPYAVGEWRGRDLEVKEYEYKILETRNLISREYVNSSDLKLYLFIIYSETNRSVFHPPEVCMVGSGLDITDKQIEKFDVGDKVFTTNKLFAEKGRFKEIILNCYKAGNIYTSNFYLQQAYLMLHQIFAKNVPGATLRVSMAIGKSQNATLATLKEFLSESAVILDRLSS